MAEQKHPSDPQDALGLLAELVRSARLLWRLLNDGRVSLGLKLIPAASLIYLLSPIDLIYDPILGLGQLDDIAVILLGIKLFISLCPQDVVRQHLRDLGAAAGGGQPPAGGDYIDAPYRVIEDDEEDTR